MSCGDSAEGFCQTYGGRQVQQGDTYFRLEVFSQTGSEGYDLMGLTQQQIIDDVIDRYAAHIAFLQLSAATDAEPFLTPATSPVAEPALLEGAPNAEIETPGDAIEADISAGEKAKGE